MFPVFMFPIIWLVDACCKDTPILSLRLRNCFLVVCANFWSLNGSENMTFFVSVAGGDSIISLSVAMVESTSSVGYCKCENVNRIQRLGLFDERLPG